MRLPFGLDLKSVIVGVLVAYFVIPWVMGMISSRRPATSAAA
jgi:hypothetical protein